MNKLLEQYAYDIVMVVKYCSSIKNIIQCIVKIFIETKYILDGKMVIARWISCYLISSLHKHGLIIIQGH